jgi:LemA protein
MNKKRYSGYIVGAVVVLLGIFIITTYNGLVKKEEKVKQQWNEVQSSYQRRTDLIPNLVNVVKGQADFEQTTLQKIVEARAKAGSLTTTTGELTAENYNKQNAVQNELASATNQLIAVVEKYPTLQGTEAFRGLQTQLEGTERRIKFSRKDFNDAIAAYNSSVRSFPTNLVAAIFGFKSKEGFQSDAGAEKAIEIKF